MFVPRPESHVPPSLPAPTAVVSPDPKTVLRVIEMLLERAGMPAAQVAARLGITPQSLNQYARSRRSNPSVKWLSRLAEVCGGRLLIELPRN